MSKKMKGYFQHPFVVMTKNRSKPETIEPPISFEEQREYILELKRQDISAKKKQLQQNQKIIDSLNNTISYAKTNIQVEREKLQTILEELREEEKQKQIQIENCQEIQSIDPEEFKLWKEQVAKVSHNKRMKLSKQKYQQLKNQKIQEINKLREQLQQVKNEQNQLNLKLEMLKGQEIAPPVVQNQIFLQPQQEIPNTDEIVLEISKLKQSIDDLQQMNANLISKVREDLDSNNWSVMDNFEKCKMHIQNQMNKLIQKMQKPNKQVFKKVKNMDKIAQPSTLIQDYQNRLNKIKQSLPQQLRQRKILECLNPLPWRTVKGITIQNHSSSAVNDKFQKLTNQLTQLDNLKTKQEETFKKKNEQIKAINQKIRQYELKIKQLKGET